MKITKHVKEFRKNGKLIINVLFKIIEHLKINNIIGLNVYWNIEKCFQIC